jgi:anti-sigma factor RsiW
MSCDVEQLESLLQHALTEPEVASLRGHLRACEDCRTELSWLQAERLAVRSHAQREARAPLPAFPTAPPRATPLVRARPRWAALAAVAAAVGLVVVRPPAAPVYDTSTAVAFIVDSDARCDEPTLSVENSFAACLVATPNMAPPDVCL